MLVDEIDFNDPAFIAGMQRLEEAVRKMNFRRAMERLTEKLRLDIRRAFIQQGRVFVSGLRSTLRRFFAEGFEGHAQFLSTPLKESITPSDWLRVWVETENNTFSLFADPIEKAVGRALQLGALATIAENKMKLSFDLANPRAVQYLRDYGARQVTRINESTRDQLQKLITQAIDEGWSYNKTAEAIIDRFDGFANGMPQQHIDSRAHLVAVTETGNAYAEGNLIVARDLQDAGLTMEKAWSTVGDSRVTEECKANEDAGWIGIDKEFPSGHQRPLRFPGCRCDLLTRLKKE